MTALSDLLKAAAKRPWALNRDGDDIVSVGPIGAYTDNCDAPWLDGGDEDKVLAVLAVNNFAALVEALRERMAVCRVKHKAYGCGPCERHEALLAAIESAAAQLGGKE